MNKFIDQLVYDYICNCDSREDLERQRDLLSKELNDGILVGTKYHKELELLNIRLKDI